MIRAERLMAARTGSMPTGRSPAGAAAHLEDGGRVAVEIGHTQRHEVGQLFAKAGYQLVADASRSCGKRPGDDVFVLTRHFSA